MRDPLKDPSKLAFIFLIIAVIAGGESISMLSCSTQRQLKSNLVAKHVISYLLIFGLLMAEGGWELKKSKQEDFNWSNGNTFDTLIWAAVIYVFIILSSKMKLKFSILLYASIFVIYVLNTYNNYLEKTNKERIAQYDSLVKTLMYICGLIMFIGVAQYYHLKKKEYKNLFSTVAFFLKLNTCKGIKN